MMKPWAFSVRGEGTEALELDIYDVIGDLGNIFEPPGITAKDVLAQLRSAPKAKTILIRINSLGGIVDDAKAMVNLLRERAEAGVDLEFRIDGIAASAAGYLTTAGGRVTMPENAFLMIHSSRAGTRSATASDMERNAKLLRDIDKQLASAFAAASAKRGKKKTTEDYLALMAEGDRYFTAEEAIEWGLADEQGEAVKVAACAASLDQLNEPPEWLTQMPYVVNADAHKGSGAPTDIPGFGAVNQLVDGSPDAQVRNGPQQANNQTPPAQPAEPEPALVGTGEQGPNDQEKNIMKDVLKTLALSEDADEAAVIAAIKKLQASAHAGAEIEKLLGCTGGEAIGAVRALKEIKSQHEDLRGQVAQLQAAGARRDFEAARDEGLKDRKLTPAQAKFYSDQFEAALANGGDAAAVVDQLKGWLQVTPKNRVVGPELRPAGEGEGAAQHNGKKYEEMAPAERARLKKESPELHDTLRQDAIARQAL